VEEEEEDVGGGCRRRRRTSIIDGIDAADGRDAARRRREAWRPRKDEARTGGCVGERRGMVAEGKLKTVRRGGRGNYALESKSSFKKSRKSRNN
jgi:hypothetical protein